VPLLPIDLQTLFTQTGQVGKEQSVAKEQIHNAQVVQGSQIERQTDARDKKVNEAEKQEGEGPGQVRKRGGREAAKERNQTRRKAKPAASAKKNVYRDPTLGSRIDISG
jgi:hypothetical protein